MARLAGFSIRGFRDFREVAHFGPWAKVNVVGGANNAGKSALLQAIQKYVTPHGDGSLGQPASRGIAALDVPDSEPIPPLSIGYLADFGDDLETGFMRALMGAPVNASIPRRLVELLSHPVFTANAVGDEGNARWFAIADSTLAIADEFHDVVAGYPYSTEVLDVLLRGNYSGAQSWDGVVTKIIADLDSPRGVVYVPANRQVSATAHRSAVLPGTDGSGLPGMLLALIAPPAAEYHRARERLQRVNGFLAAVLDRPTASLLVPHDADTVHVALEDRVRPLSHLGAGIEQAVLLATICTEYSDHLVLIEEPDLFMHPTLQRRFLRHLRDDDSDNIYIATTHSAALLDTDWANVFRVDWTPGRGTVVSLVSKPSDRAQLATSLGFRASDLVQANVVIWVEGPSDRIYLKRWLELVGEEAEDGPGERLIEGVHFSFVMYGGRLGQHLTASEKVEEVDRAGVVDGMPPDNEVDRLVQIYRINRHAVFVMDSDRASDADDLAPYKTRLEQEFAESGEGVLWVTAGRMIENYVDPEVHRSSYEVVHTRSRITYCGDLLADPFAGGATQPNKVRLAEVASGATAVVPDRGDLRAKVAQVRDYLRSVNGLAVRATAPRG